MRAISKVRTLRQRLRWALRGDSSLDDVIPPEVTNDAFSRVIEELAADPSVLTALEIGSSNGAGSTRALVEGLRPKERQQLHCLELSRPRFAQLLKRYEDLPWVCCHNLTSVSAECFPAAEDVARFYEVHPESPLRQHPLKEVQSWLRQDLEYVKRADQPQGGIRMIMEATGITVFDLVLIDGSEFTGGAELTEVYGARYILLDDTRTFKNHASYERLSHDPTYALIAEDATCRNGFAAFGLA